MTEKKRFRVFATSRIGDAAENRLRECGYDLEVFQGPEAPPKKLIIEKVKSGIDGLITTLCMLRTMTEAGRALHELTEGFETFPQILVNVEVKVKQPFAEVPSIQNAVREIEAILGSRGRLLLRYSGTEPLARVMIEGESQNEIEKHAKELASIIQKELGA